MIDKEKFEKIRHGLTKSKTRVFNQLLEKKSYTQIAKNLGITDSTLRKHISTIYQEFEEFFPEKEASERFTRNDFLNLVAEHSPELLNIPISENSDLTYVPHISLEEFCHKLIEEERGLLRIQASPKMGKTALLSRLIKHSEAQGHRVASVNCEDTEASDRKDLDTFLQWFCIKICSELEMPISYVKKGSNNIKEKVAIRNIDDFKEYWECLDWGNAKSKCKKFFQAHLLSQDSILVLGIDNMEDTLFDNKDVFTDFLMMLANWHREAVINSDWRNLCQILVCNQDYPNLNHSSPFNPGTIIKIPEFNLEQIQELVQKYNLTIPIEKIMELTNLVGGHPYLLDIALTQIARGTKTIEDIIQEGSSTIGIYGKYLQDWSSFLAAQPEALTILRKVSSGVKIEKSSQGKDLDTISRLNRLGLVKWAEEKTGHVLVAQCKLYQEYFQTDL
jgi:hypothetical protein